MATVTIMSQHGVSPVDAVVAVTGFHKEKQSMCVEMIVFKKKVSFSPVFLPPFAIGDTKQVPSFRSVWKSQYLTGKKRKTFFKNTKN